MKHAMQIVTHTHEMPAEIHLLMIAESSLSTTLEHEGYRSVGIQAYVASGFGDVKKIMNKQKIDVVLIDWEYTRLNPFEVITYIRSHHVHKNLPIIVSSVHICDDKIGKYKEIDLFIKQPVPRVLLLERIRRLLKRNTRGADRVPWTDFYLGSVKAKCDKEILSMVLADLSMTGIYLYSETALDVGKSVDLEFSLPGISELLQIEGQVVRVTRMHKINDKMNKGVAIQFTKFNGVAENTLSSFLNENKPESNFMHYYL